MTSQVMSQDQLQEYLKERYSVILTDDYVPVDNLIALIFEERFDIGNERDTIPLFPHFRWVVERVRFWGSGS